MAITMYGGFDGVPITEPQFGVSVSDWATQMGVVGAGDWKVSAGTNPGQLNIAAGTGWGFGVTTVSDAIASVTQAALPAGAGAVRWDLVAMRRDWQPPGGTCTFVIVQGSTDKQLPASAAAPGSSGRQTFPGVVYDQPLALVQWTAGYTSPTAIVDLRVWAGNGGLVAKDDLVRTFMNRIGTTINIGSTTWVCRLGDNDTPTWFQLGLIERINASTVDSTWAYNVTLTRYTDAAGTKSVTCGFLVARIGGGGFNVDAQPKWTPLLAGLIPAGWQPNDSITCVGSYEFNGFGALLLRFKSDGGVDASALSGSVSMAKPTRLQASAHWTCA